MNFKKIKTTLTNAVKSSYYVGRYKHARIDKKLILLDSRHGEALGGNILALARALDRRGGYKLAMTTSPQSRTQTEEILNGCGLGGKINLVDIKSFACYKALCKARYIFTDVSLPMRYIKRKGQTVVNVWHGTPLKCLGRDVEDGIHQIGNVQRNFLLSDYLLYPSEYMRDKMLPAYDIDGIFKGTILLGGYPRNEAFFNKPAAEALRERLGFAGKRVYVYMPTWRGGQDKRTSKKLIADVTAALKKLDGLLSDDEVLIAKLHPFVSGKLDLSGFSHIIPMPAGADSYEVLAFADCLVTDYSSVFFDYAAGRGKVVLFVYDAEKYSAERGMYMSLDELPFPKVRTPEELITELRSPKGYDDTEFLKKFCPYDCADASDKLLARVLDGKKTMKEERIPDDGRENVLIFGGCMKRNGITASLISLLENTDLNKRRYFITFQQGVLNEYPEQCRLIPRKARVMPMCTKPQFTFLEGIGEMLFYKLNLGLARKLIERMCRRDAVRFFGSVDFSAVIQFEGYGKNMIHLFRMFKCRKAIFVHNDMLKELKEKNIQHRLTLEAAYRDFDKVACVTEGMIPPVREISGRSDNITVVNNIHPYKRVLEQAAQPLRFDKNTKSTVKKDKLEELLSGSGMKLISVGRFSYEKGHDLLIEAFERFNKAHPDSLLIIIGGYGELYAQTLKKAKESAAAERIVIINSMSNPMPVMKRCDLFVLSSRHEAMPVTIFEADTLHLPVISTEINGPKDLMAKYGGMTVPVSAEGIYEGMEAFAEGKVPLLNIDGEKFNRRAAAQFELLLAK